MSEDQSAAAEALAAERRAADRRDHERRDHERRSDSLEAPFLAEAPQTEWNGRESRRLERFPVQGTRPVGIRLLQPDGEAADPWMLADILDISLGGLCLLVSGQLALQRGQILLLDLRSHPDFATLRLQVQVCWSISSDSFSTIGIAFPSQLPRIPKLELERRQARRDPNVQTWVSE